MLRAASDTSDSAYLLELLAFELLLKLVMEKTTQSAAPVHHHYDTIFGNLRKTHKLTFFDSPGSASGLPLFLPII